MEKITAPAGTIVNGPAQPQQGNPHGLFWVNGELYVDLGAQPEAAPLVDNWTRRGYTVQTGQTAPQAYLDAAASMAEQVRQHFGYRPPTASQDAEDPARTNYVPPPGG